MLSLVPLVLLATTSVLAQTVIRPPDPRGRTVSAPTWIVLSPPVNRQVVASSYQSSSSFFSYGNPGNFTRVQAGFARFPGYGYSTPYGAPAFDFGGYRSLYGYPGFVDNAALSPNVSRGYGGLYFAPGITPRLGYGTKFRARARGAYNTPIP